jgi:putative membrane protein
MMNGWSGSASGWDWTWMLVAVAALCTLAAVGVTAAVHFLGRGGNPRAIEPPAAPSAEDVLADRFARGEIGEDEYWQRVCTLRAAELR